MNNDFINYSNYYIPEDIPRKKKHKKRKSSIKKQNAGLVALSVLLSILLTFNLISAILLTSIGAVFKEKGIERLITSVLDDIEISEIEITVKNDTKKLSDLILDMAYQYKGFQGISKEDIDFDKLEEFAKLFILQTFENNESTSGDITELGWTAEQIYDFIANNQETIRDLLISSGYEGKIPIEENKDALIKTLKKNIGENGISVGGIIENFDESGTVMTYIDIVQRVFSSTSILIVWSLATILALVLIPVNLKFFAAYLRSIGIPMIISGAFVSILMLASGSLIGMIPFLENENVKQLISSVFNGLSKQINSFSVTILISGILITVISIIISIVKRRKNA